MRAKSFSIGNTTCRHQAWVDFLDRWNYGDGVTVTVHETSITPQTHSLHPALRAERG